MNPPPPSYSSPSSKAVSRDDFDEVKKPSTTMTFENQSTFGYPTKDGHLVQSPPEYPTKDGHLVQTPPEYGQQHLSQQQQLQQQSQHSQQQYRQQQQQQQYLPQQQNLQQGKQLPVILIHPAMGRFPQRMQCPCCKKQMITSIRKRNGKLTYISCFGIALFFPFGCCLIPFCIDEFKDTDHYCPCCNAMVGTVEAC